MAVPRKIIQLVVWKHLLIALTDKSEVWALHGLEQMPVGAEPLALKWRKLAKELPPEDTTETHATW